MSCDKAAPAVWFQYSANRKGEHPGRHLKKFSGILQADAYSGNVAAKDMWRPLVRRRTRHSCIWH